MPYDDGAAEPGVGEMLPMSQAPRLAATIQVIAGMIPAVIATVVGMLICLIALFLPERHQAFALKVQTGMIDLARVLVGATTTSASQATKEITTLPDTARPERASSRPRHRASRLPQPGQSVRHYPTSGRTSAGRRQIGA